MPLVRYDVACRELDRALPGFAGSQTTAQRCEACDVTEQNENPEATPAQQNARVDGFDVLRLLCVLGVVVLHVAAQAELVTGSAAMTALGESMRWSTPALFVISGFLAGSAPARAFFTALGRRAKRLLVPYAFWTVVYVAVAMVVDHSPAPTLFAVVFMGGSQYSTHLWFLVTLMICVPIGLLLKNRWASLCAVVIGLALLGARYLTGWTTPLDWQISLYYPFLNWLELYLLGVLAGQWWTRSPTRAFSAWLTVAAPVAIAVGVSAAVEWTVGGTSLAGFVTLAAVAVALTLVARVSAGVSRQVSAVSSTALGVYIVHPLFMAAFGRIVPVAAIGPWAWVAVATVCVAALSIAVTLALARMPFVRRVVQ